jgi:hypothetical protein
MGASIKANSRSAWFVIIVLGIHHPTAGQSQSTSPECGTAQVLSLSSAWSATPGSRILQKWDCLNAGDELRHVTKELPAQITVIYRDGDIPPHTERCSSESPCRNAYRVQRPPEPPSAGSAFQDILNMFFSHPRPKVIPGILFGLDLSDAKVYGKSGVVPGAPGAYSADSPPAPTAPVAVLCNDSGEVDVSELLMGDRTTITFATMPSTKTFAKGEAPLVEIVPNLYYLQISRDQSQIGVAVAIIEPRGSCAPKKDALAKARAITESWPKDMPESAKRDFLLLYLDGLVTRPGN